MSSSSTELEGDDISRPSENACPLCKGLGFVRTEVPLDHPDFGKLIPCACRMAQLAERRVAALRSVSDMDSLARMT
ncbi:MAG: hypothetical protein GX601_05575, partial [Anaerolineales bacterium]|nr:hypothetical protein [Anaerolineales bacterium]